MLPFLKKNEAAVAEKPKTLTRPETKREVPAMLEVAMKELFQAQDDKSRALAFKAAFEILEMSPHKEGPHNG